MKKLIALVCTLILTFALVACGSTREKVKVKTIELTQESYAFAIAKENTELKTVVDEYLAEIIENGELDNIINSFFDGTTDFEYSNPESKDGCFVVATNAYFPPFEYYKGNKLTGIDIQIAYNIAKKLGKTLYVEDMDFTAVIPSVQSGNCEIAMAGLTVNEDRLKVVDFSLSYYESAQVLIVKESDTTFDNCTTAAEIEAILSSMDASYKIGAQQGTTGYMYSKGDESFGYDGFTNLTTLSFTTGALAVRDLSNGKLNAVIIDLQPAIAITTALNKTIK
ncbi:MAG: transporter substrate-binding domain-containing protein [Clostridia bacterium]|nr:transporter substrate-binding domain-containing protein [Clostridia bacterium]